MNNNDCCNDFMQFCSSSMLTSSYTGMHVCMHVGMCVCAFYSDISDYQCSLYNYIKLMYMYNYSIHVHNYIISITVPDIEV